MSALDDIAAKIENLRSAVATAKAQVDAALSEAHDKAQEAASLGIEGVAATVQAAHDELEAANSNTGSAHDAADSAAGGLKEITAKTGRRKPPDASPK